MKLFRRDNGRAFRLISDNGDYATVLDIVADIRMVIKSESIDKMFVKVEDDKSN